MTQVTAREFRENIATFFDKVDAGEQIIIKRGSKKAYILTPVTDEDLFFTPEMYAKIDQALQEVKEGKVQKLTPELRAKLFGDV